MSKVKIVFPPNSGQQVDATEIEVGQTTDSWSVTRLADGATVRSKVVISGALRVDGQFDASGNPIYVFNMTPIINVSPPSSQ